MRLRIISETQCDNTVFKVQRKILFWWFTVSSSEIAWHGEMGSQYDLTFDSMEEAEEYICRNYSKPSIKILKEIVC
jgi:hypothetical protein